MTEDHLQLKVDQLKHVAHLHLWLIRYHLVAVNSCFIAKFYANLYLEVYFGDFNSDHLSIHGILDP